MTRTRRVLAVAIAAATIAVTPSEVCAQPSPEPEVAAQQELEAGLAAYQRGDYASAIARFRHAYELHESPQYLYAWAQAARSAGDCAAAIDLYRRFIDTGATGDSRVAAEQNEARCREQLQQARARAQAEPQPEAPLPQPAPDPATSTARSPADPAAPDDPPDDRTPPSRAPDRIGLGLLVAGSAAVIAGGTVLAISGVRRVRQSDTVQYDRFDTLDAEIDRLDIAGGVTLGVGAALAIGGAIRLGLVHRKRRNVARTTFVAPAFGPGGTPMLVLSIRPAVGR